MNKQLKQSGPSVQRLNQVMTSDKVNLTSPLQYEQHQRILHSDFENKIIMRDQCLEKFGVSGDKCRPESVDDISVFLAKIEMIKGIGALLRLINQLQNNLENPYFQSITIESVLSRATLTQCPNQTKPNALFKQLNALIRMTNESDNINESAVEAAKIGQIECLKLFMADSRCSDLHWAIYEAAQFGHVDCVKEMLNDRERVTDLNPSTYVATRNNQIECLKVLLEDGRYTTLLLPKKEAQTKGFSECEALIDRALLIK